MTAMDAPIYDPDAWRLTDQERALTEQARRFGQAVLAPRASRWDTEASFPMDNYRDMHREGLLGVCVPQEDGGIGADYRAYCLTAAELGRYCGATALTWNMHVCSTLWTGALTEGLEMDGPTREEHKRRRRVHYDRILKNGAIYAQPFSEGGSAAAGVTAFGTTAKRVDGGYLVNGKKIFASLAGSADYYGVLCTEDRGDRLSRRDTLYMAVPSDAPGVTVTGDWDPLGMRGTVSRDLLFKDVIVPDDAALMPPGLYFQAATRFPHMFMTLSPTYMGIAQAAVDFTVKYLRGEWPGMPPVKRRMYPTKQIAVAQMTVMLEQTKALWFQAITDARPDPTREQVMRAWAAQHTVMENANALCALAIRTCGGQSMLKTLPIERLYRDSRCGSLMLPWTAELCLDRLGRAALYRDGETDD